MLDEAFGVGAGTSLFDKSRYRSHGAITTATWAAGAHGRCLDFVAANPDYVEIPAAFTQLDFTAQDFSIIARFNIDILPVFSYLFDRGAYQTDGYACWIEATGKLVFLTYQFGFDQQSQTALGAIIIGNWYTVGISRTGASVRVYLNGLDATATVGVHNNPTTAARHFVLGTDTNLAAFPYDGKIEFLRIFRNIALSPSEHLAWHNALA